MFESLDESDKMAVLVKIPGYERVIEKKHTMIKAALISGMITNIFCAKSAFGKLVDRKLVDKSSLK
jgi:hypothetical protein